MLFVLLAQLSLAGPSMAAPEVLPSIICPRLTEGPASSDQSNIVASTAAIFVLPGAARPQTAILEGLDTHPHGTKLRMNYQDALGLGSEKDGVIVYAEPGTGDGTLQFVCGEEANVIINDARLNKTYCGSCAVNPGFGGR